MAFKTTPLSPLNSPQSTPPRDRGYFSRLVLTGVSLTVIAFVGVSAMGNVSLAGLSLDTLFSQVIPPVTLSSGSTQTPTTSEERTNILLVGVGGVGHEAPELTDTIMLAGIDSDKKFVSFLSLPRDLYVRYPNGGAGKINEIYRLALSWWADQITALRTLGTKVTEITGQKVDHVLMVDFRAFTQVVDHLGGIEVDVPENLVDTSYPDSNWGYEVFRVQKWIQVMNGATALKYARSRHSTSDFDRARRQQMIIGAIRDKALSSDALSSLPEIYTSLASHIFTDLSVKDIISLIYDSQEISRDRIVGFQLSDACIGGGMCRGGAWLYTPQRDLFGGASVLLPTGASSGRVEEYDGIHLFAHLLFDRGETFLAPHPIMVVTHPKWVPQARRIIDTLRRLGFQMADKPLVSKSTLSSTGVTHVSYVWDEANSFGIPPESPVLSSLTSIIPSLPLPTSITGSTYTTLPEPVIELHLGADAVTILWDL